MHDQALQRAARVLHLEDAHRPSNIALVANLTTTLRIERRGIEQHQCLLRGADALHLFTIDNKAHHLAAAVRLDSR